MCAAGAASASNRPGHQWNGWFHAQEELPSPWKQATPSAHGAKPAGLKRQAGGRALAHMPRRQAEMVRRQVAAVLVLLASACGSRCGSVGVRRAGAAFYVLKGVSITAMPRSPD